MTKDKIAEPGLLGSIESDPIDSKAAIYTAGRAGVDAAGLLARYAGVKMSLH